MTCRSFIKNSPFYVCKYCSNLINRKYIDGKHENNIGRCGKKAGLPKEYFSDSSDDDEDLLCDYKSHTLTEDKNLHILRTLFFQSSICSHSGKPIKWYCKTEKCQTCSKVFKMKYATERFFIKFTTLMAS